MDAWTLEKWFAVSGALLQIAGFAVLALIDYSAWRAAQAQDSIREDQLAEIFRSARDGVEYEPSTQELEVTKLQATASKSSKYLRIGLGLACVGAIFQLIAALVSKQT
jgi:hypothetical protein